MFLDHELRTPSQEKKDRSRSDLDSSESGIIDGFGRPPLFQAMLHSNTSKAWHQAIYGRPSTRREMVTERVGDRPEDIRGRSPGDGRRQ